MPEKKVVSAEPLSKKVISVEPLEGINLSRQTEEDIRKRELETEQERQRSVVTRMTGESLPIIGSLLGGPGDIPLNFLGATGGSLIQQLLQKYRPDVFGQPSESPITSALIEGGINTATNILGYPPARYAGALAQGTEAGLKATLASKFMKKPLDPDVATYLQSHENLPATVSQLGGSEAAKIGESVLAPFARRKIRDIQQEYLSNEAKQLLNQFGGELTPEQVANLTREQISSGFFKITNRVKELYNNLESAASLNTAKQITYKNSKMLDSAGDPIKVIDKVVNIKGPIYFNSSVGLADRILERLEDFYGVKSGPELIEVVKRHNPQVAKLLVDLQTIQGTFNKETKQLNPIPINLAIDIKKTTGNIGFKEQFPNLEEKTFIDLNRLVDSDIKNSIARYSNADVVTKFYEDANRVAALKINLFKKTPTTESMIESKIGNIQDIQKILKDPELIRRTIGASSKPIDTRKALASEFLSDIFQKSAPERIFNAKYPIDTFLSRENDATIRNLFTARERAGIIQFFKTIAQLDPKLPLAGVTAFGIRAIGTGFIFGSGVIRGVMTEKLSSAVTTSGSMLGAAIGANQFVKKILLDNTTARLAVKLAKLPPESAEAKAITRTLFGAMKGVQLTLMTPEGVELGPAVVNKNGKIEQVQVGKED